MRGLGSAADHKSLDMLELRGHQRRGQQPLGDHHAVGCQAGKRRAGKPKRGADHAQRQIVNVVSARGHVVVVKRQQHILLLFGGGKHGSGGRKTHVRVSGNPVAEEGILQHSKLNPCQFRAF